MWKIFLFFLSIPFNAEISISVVMKGIDHWNFNDKLYYYYCCYFQNFLITLEAVR